MVDDLRKRANEQFRRKMAIAAILVTVPAGLYVDIERHSRRVEYLIWDVLKGHDESGAH